MNRRLASAMEAGAATRRALLRATARPDGPQFSAAAAAWVDTAQSVSSTLQSVFRTGIDTAADRSAAADQLRPALQRARDLRTDLGTVARGMRADASPPTARTWPRPKLPAPKDPKAAELLSKTLDRMRGRVGQGACSGSMPGPAISTQS